MSLSGKEASRSQTENNQCTCGYKKKTLQGIEPERLDRLRRNLLRSKQAVPKGTPNCNPGPQVVAGVPEAAGHRICISDDSGSYR